VSVVRGGWAPAWGGWRGLLWVGLVVVEVVLLGWWLAAGSTLVYVLLQFPIAALVALTVVVCRYRRFRRAFEAGIAAAAVADERSRLAEEMHDALGHELSVIALRASALQLRSTGDVREQAATLRADVERAVGVLRESLEVLGGGGAGTRYEPSTETTERLLARVSASGAQVVVAGALPAELPATVERTVYRIVREALTNATRHAPGAPVSVSLTVAGERLEITVANPVVPRDAPRPGDAGVPAGGSGVAGLKRRVSLLGGTVTAGVTGDQYSLVAELPLHPVAVGTTPSGQPTPPATSWAERPPARPLAATLRSVAVPGAVAVAALLAFYVWATTGATLEDAAFAGVAAGEPQAGAERVLPGRQSPVRLTRFPPQPKGWTCRHYTDGNFPLGMSTFEVCFADGRVVRTADARRERP
jgi:signal transduction histidine kinase